MSEDGQLLKTCRQSLGFTVRDMQVELCIEDERTMRRLEDGEIDVRGPTWLAMYFILLREGMTELAEQVFDIINIIRTRASAKIIDKAERYQVRKSESNLVKARRLLMEDQEYR